MIFLFNMKNRGHWLRSAIVWNANILRAVRFLLKATKLDSFQNSQLNVHNYPGAFNINTLGQCGTLRCGTPKCATLSENAEIITFGHLL